MRRSPPIVVLEPSRLWHRRAAIFAGVVLVLALGSSVLVPHVLLLVPVMGYQLVYSLRFLEPGRVGIALYDDQLVVRYPFRKPVTLRKDDVVCFLLVFQSGTEQVVARLRDVDPRGADGQKLMHPSDVMLPPGLMRNVGLVGRLEAWRTGSFNVDSLMSLTGHEALAG